MKYRIVELTTAGWTTQETENVTALMTTRGVELMGYNHNPRQRSELQDQPQFKGFLGPMWDGDAIRYENSAAYDSLST